MAISADYPHPVTVNGFQCRNCTDVDRAKKNIDPANPQGGPFGANDPKKLAARARFVEEARNIDKLEELAKKAAPVSNPVAAAYAMQGGQPAGSLVNVSA